MIPHQRELKERYLGELNLKLNRLIQQKAVVQMEFERLVTRRNNILAGNYNIAMYESKMKADKALKDTNVEIEKCRKKVYNIDTKITRLQAERLQMVGY